MTSGGKLLDDKGEFDAKQFEEMMLNELLRYAQRQLTFCMTETSDKDNKVMRREGVGAGGDKARGVEEGGKDNEDEAVVDE
eukprot:498817-Hanusia_phi.AAC.2